jgi:hypothetical protein
MVMVVVVMMGVVIAFVVAWSWLLRYTVQLFLF